MAGVALEVQFAALPVAIQSRLFSVLDQVNAMTEDEKENARSFFSSCERHPDLPKPVQGMCGAADNLLLWAQVIRTDEQVYRAVDDLIASTQPGEFHG